MKVNIKTSSLLLCLLLLGSCASQTKEHEQVLINHIDCAQAVQRSSDRATYELVMSKLGNYIAENNIQVDKASLKTLWHEKGEYFFLNDREQIVRVFNSPECLALHEKSPLIDPQSNTASTLSDTEYAFGLMIFALTPYILFILFIGFHAVRGLLRKLGISVEFR